ncbi:hypothetical protein SBA4_4800006 [Candidatus Sulfopaludibacter sp. SbA4]|nr:hypothetical protein SBA4_4800006 [Candidatus Sulfopaludibacter sp. SbA4]
MKRLAPELRDWHTTRWNVPGSRQHQPAAALPVSNVAGNTDPSH